MSNKKVPKKTVKPSLTQKERFIEYAKEVESYEDDERFNKALSTVLNKEKSKK